MPTYPIPRLETGAHTDRPNDIGFDPVKNQLISVSDDRSIRFWDFDTGRQVDVLYVPMSTRKDGELYALSIAPKARMLVVGGWTGYSWDKSISIYVFHLDTLEMLGRVSQIPERIVALEFSPDESRLATSLLDGKLMLFSMPGFSLIGQNHDCKNVSYRLSYSTQGTVAANCFDGFVRLYDNDLKLIAKSEPLPDHQVSSVSFSPDGESLLVTYYDKLGVYILDSKTLEITTNLDAGIDADVPLAQGAWSSDGRHIFAGGDHSVDGSVGVLRWKVDSGEQPEFFPVSQKRIFRLVSLNDGGVAYTTLDQSVGRLSAKGAMVFDNRPPSINHEGKDFALLATEDGATIQFATGNPDFPAMRFSVVDRQLYETGYDNTILHAPVSESANIKIENWKDSAAPSVNGSPIKLAAQQTSRSYAISHDSQFFALGLDSQIRMYTRTGETVWSVFTNAGPYSLNITRDGKTLIAALQDGSIRWYSTETGAEYYALYAHRDGKEWVAWTPPGFYISSANGDQYIGWHINEAPDAVAQFYSAWQFERLLYRPDIVESYFKSQGKWSDSELPSSYRNKTMRENAPPELAVQVTVAKSEDKATVTINAEKISLPISHYSVFVNDLPVLRYAERAVSGKDDDKLSRSHEITLPEVENIIRVEVYTDNSIAVKETYLRTNKSQGIPKGDLYLVAVGVNHFDKIAAEQEIDLQYAAQDSEIISSILKSQENQFRKSYVTVLNDFTDAKPYKQEILKALQSLQNTGPNDTVIVFLASHGISNEAGDYFMVPRDAIFEDLSNVMGNNSQSASSLIKWNEIVDAIRDASGKRFLIVDTCQAEKIEGNFDFGSLAKRSSAMSFGILSASSGDEVAQEYPPGKQGLFSYSLAKALNGEGDLNGDKIINISELHTFTSEYVDAERLDRSQTQTPQLVAPPVLENTPFRLLAN